MTERLLQFIWRFGYFNKSQLQTDGHEPIIIISPGVQNLNQGPDFSDAKIRIDKITWSGSVELHLQTSGWKKHNHHKDRNYNNVILHVVWEHDMASDNLPVLELKSRVSKLLLRRYEELMHSPFFIPCEKNILTIDTITWTSWKERLLVERLLRKAAVIENYLQQNKMHWEETCWWLLARNFGIKVNADAFEAIARSLPLKLLAKQKQQIQQLEALLLGQGGLLKKQFTDDYSRSLQAEYSFLQKKYTLHPIRLPIHFLRMRPGNFPTIRLAQLAKLVRESNHLFSRIKEAATAKEVRSWFHLTASNYWDTHYHLDEPAAFKQKTIGNTMIDNIFINTIIPLLFAYGNHYQEQRYKNKALQWLETIATEHNAIIKDFEQTGIIAKDAFDSQALIELKNEYCSKKRCLDCAIGNKLLKSLC